MADLSDDDLRTLLAAIDPDTKRLPPGFRMFARAAIAADRALNAPQAAPVREPAKWVDAMCALVSEWGSAHHQMHIHMAAGRVEDSLLAARYCNDVMREIERCLSLAATPQAAPVAPAEPAPPGWQLVPVEPTQEMVRALADNVSLMNFERGSRIGYAAMLAAAPHPATAGTTDAGGV